MDKIFKALADPTRRRVLKILRDGPRTAGELSSNFEVSKATMSAHFSVLRDAGLVDAKKQGRTITYRLRLSVLEEALLGFTEAFRPETKLERPRSGAGKLVEEEV
jgi:DNA-binding transcriptional ArsR family regulator